MVWTLSKMLRAIALASLLLVGCGRVAFGQTASVPEFTDLGSDSLETIEGYKAGQRIRFRANDGQELEAIFTGERLDGGPGQPTRFGVTGVTPVQRAGGDPSQPQGGGTRDGSTSPSEPQPNGQGGQQRGAPSSGLGAAGVAAAVTLAGYIAIPPSLRNELRDRAGALQDAIRKGEAAVELHSRAASEGVTGAASALAQLRAQSKTVTFVPVPAPSFAAAAHLPDLSKAPFHLRRALESSFVALTSIAPPSPAHASVRATGLHAVSFAQQQIESGDIGGAQAATQIATAAASVLRNAGDLIVGLNPLTAMARDATELLTGKDLFSGEQLSSGELWVRGISLGVSLVTSGAASSVRQAISRIAPMADAVGGTRKLLDYTLEVTRHIRARWYRAGGTDAASDAAVRDLAFDAISKGTAYWDTKEKTTAFFLRQRDQWIQIALDVKQGKAVTVVARKIDYDFSRAIRTEEGLARRFIPIDEVSIPTAQGASGSIKLYLPGAGSP